MLNAGESNDIQEHNSDNVFHTRCSRVIEMANYVQICIMHTDDSNKDIRILITSITTTKLMTTTVTVSISGAGKALL